MSSDCKTVVCDIGTSTLKLGYANDPLPRHIVPSIVAERESSDAVDSLPDTSTRFICGKNARNLLYKQPIESGTIRDWNSMNALLRHAFCDVLLHPDYQNNDGNDVDLNNHKVLLTEPSFAPIDQRQKLTESMFEHLGVGAINFSNQALLVLYGQGLLTGMVVECGEGVTQIVPVYEGYVSKHLIKRHAVSGKTVTNYLSKLLQLRGYYLKSTSDLETVRDIKDKLCYTACDLDLERRLARETTALVESYTLPDGTNIRVGQERFEASEAYFDPSVVDIESKGLSDVVFDTIQECDINCRVQYYEHVILSGGSSMFPGMPNRLQNELEKRYFKDILKEDESRVKKFKINVEAPTNRNNLVYIGGSILSCSIQGSADFWTTKGEYDELGIDRIFSRNSL